MLVLVAVVAVLQVVHLILLSRLEAKHHHHENDDDRPVSSGNEVRKLFGIIALLGSSIFYVFKDIIMTYRLKQRLRHWYDHCIKEGC